MDERQQRITEDLSSLLKGEIVCDPLTCAIYSTDASLYRIKPSGVAFPKDRDDVITLSRYSSETNLPLIARGAGTGLAGSALGDGLIVDFSRFMKKVEFVDETTVRVQPGIVRDQLNNILRKQGRYLPPDPSNSSLTTIGGMLGVNAAGSHSIHIGSMRDYVESLELVLPGGEVIEAGIESLDILAAPIATSEKSHPLLDALVGNEEEPHPKLKRTIISKLAKLLRDHRELIEKYQPGGIPNSCGYFLREVLSDQTLNLPRLLVGSEGTLGLFSAATLRTAPLPAHRGAVLLLFGKTEGAIIAAQKISELQPSACDMMGRRLLSLAREADLQFEKLISPAAESALLVEQVGSSEQEVKHRLKEIIQTVKETQQRFAIAMEAFSPTEVDFLWSLPGKIVSRLTQLKGETRPLPFVEDIAIPPAALQEFLISAQKVFQKHEVTTTFYAHVAAGQLHMRPFLPLPLEENGLRLEAIARDLYQLVFSVGGSISGEHGDGLSRTAFIRSQYGPLYRVFQQIKDIFDPHNLCNPGKIVNDDPHITRRHLRSASVKKEKEEPYETRLNWELPQLLATSSACNGCGECRTESVEERMCPFFRLDHSENSSPRAKANLLCSLLEGNVDARKFASAEMKQITDTCFNCKQCEIECPSHVNIPQMMIEAKAHLAATNGLRWSDWVLSRTDTVGAFGCTIPMIANWMIGHSTVRWVIEKVLGIAQQRKLPSFARRSFLRQIKSAQPEKTSSLGEKPVVLFVDHYANYHDPDLAMALMAILKHHEIETIVPQDQMASGMAMISVGDLDAARKLAETNVLAFAEYAREGHSILCIEPTAALCLKKEYPLLLDNPDVQLVADKVIEAGAFLEQLHLEGKLKTDFLPLSLNVGYHLPCHLKAESEESSLLKLVALIPDLQWTQIEKGCSGMAGSFGMTKENYQTSLQIGWGLISEMRSGRYSIGITECSSCKIQMEQGTTTPTLHPLKLLAIAYGLMPALEEKLKPTTNQLTIT
ncbi:Fe-S protein, homolog of lactate dehydrogenase SO1521 [hydrothermal vent metagenome]|uniref:Fe-S protein, homolog of lactate dehydrogenase SO1521 n=1 Tax=hydrothermal vent metagenome TaxID=652676 RepID=A0A3B1D913_9ZZZZ